MKWPIPYFKKYLKKGKWYISTRSQEFRLICFFVFLFWLIWMRLFSLQLVQGASYKQKLVDQHYTKSSLEAERWNIFVSDKSWENIQLTENIDIYDVYVDPEFIVDKQQLIDDLTPIFYEHLCVVNQLDEPTQLECLQNLESFSSTEILPKKQYTFFASWSMVTFWTGEAQLLLDQKTAYGEELTSILELATPAWIENQIRSSMEDRIQIWYRERNYIWEFSEEPWFLEELEKRQFPFIEIQWTTAYVLPEKVTWKSFASRELYEVLSQFYWDDYPLEYIRNSLVEKKLNRYVKLAVGLNVNYVDRIRSLKENYYNERLDLKSNKYILSRTLSLIESRSFDWISIDSLIPDKAKEVKKMRKSDGEYSISLSDIRPEILSTQWVVIPAAPAMHGIWLEKSQRRYYPYDSFMSHIIWYVDRSWVSNYWVESYLDNMLRGKNGKIVWLATPWIGQIGSNAVEVEQPEDWDDVYLTVDPIVQKEIETIGKNFRNYFWADSVAITVLDPHTWKVVSLVNSPTFNPNEYEDEYKLNPLTIQQRYLVEDPTRIDIPIYVLSGTDLHQANSLERKDITKKKYYFNNLLWPQVFIDKNIAFPYEPWSIFKSLTLAIGIDSDALGLYDYYNDPWKVKVGQYTISNISFACTWDHTFSHALAYSCNVWMVRMAQKILKYVFYSYLGKLWFWEKTGVELAGEDWWTLPDFNTVSKARFFNNTYGQWILSTPLQMAAAYAATVNWWWYIKPTIVEAMYNPLKKRFITMADTEKTKVFKSTTSDQMKEALVNVVNYWNLKDEIYVPGVSLWGKTWTSEISYKGTYRSWKWRTNTSFVWIVSARDIKYVVAIQVRRPRTSQRWLDTAWKLFSSVADFLMAYEQIEK